jgi:YD repeat-containing protein
MKLPSFLLSTAVLFIIITAFVAAPLPKVKQIVNLRSGKATTYTYTADGRILSIKNYIGGGSFYEYSGRGVIRKINSDLTKVTAIDTFILNNKGVAIESHNAEEWSNGIRQPMTYNESGYPLESKMLDKGKVMFTDRRDYKDNNAISQSQKSQEYKNPNMLYFTYYTDKVNTIGNGNTGLSFMGHSSKNLIKENICISTSGDTSRVFYTYHFDERDRVIVRSSYRNGMMMDSVGYTYY